MRKSANLCWSGLALCALVITFSACAGSSKNWSITSIVAPATTASGNPIPRVQNCIAINTGSTSSPSKYVCNGKTYTSHELRKIREDAANGTVASK